MLPNGSAGITVIRRSTLRVQVFLEFFYWLALTFAKAPDPSKGVEGRWPCRILAVHASSSCTASPARTLLLVVQSFPQVRAVPNCTARSVCILTGIVTGAAGHNRGGVVETPLFARTQGGNFDGARHRCFWS